MLITLEKLAVLFPEYHPVVQNKPPVICLVDSMRLPDDLEKCSVHTLYVCTRNDLERVCSLHTGAGVKRAGVITGRVSLLILEKEMPGTVQGHSDCLLPALPEPVRECCSYILLHCADEALVCARLRSYFHRWCGVGLFADSMLDCLSAEKGIYAMVDSAANVLQNPIVVFDAGFHMIASSGLEDLDDNLAPELRAAGGFDEKIFRLVNANDHIHERVKKSEHPVYNRDSQLQSPRMICALDTQRDIGHIAVAAVNRDFSSLDEVFLEILRNAVREQLQKDVFVRNNKGFYYEYYLRDLLDGRVYEMPSEIRRMHYEQAEFSGTMYCLVIEMNRMAETLNVRHIRNLFEWNFPDTLSMQYKQGIVVIFRLRSVPAFTEHDLQLIRAICTENMLYAGLSNSFTDITELSGYYLQALQAITLGMRQDQNSYLFRYRDYYIQHLMHEFSKNGSVQNICHPKLRILLDHDRRSGEHLSEVLYCYLKQERNLSSAASSLHMHRNTLYNHLKKIDRLTQIDYEDYQERMYLLLSCEMMRCFTAQQETRRQG